MRDRIAGAVANGTVWAPDEEEQLPTSDLLYTVAAASLKGQSEVFGGLTGLSEHVKDALKAGLIIQVGETSKGVAKKYAFCKKKNNGGQAWNPPVSNAVVVSTAPNGPLKGRKKSHEE